MAIPGGIAAIAWVDATNIKTNLSNNAALVGVCQIYSPTSGAILRMLIATKSLLKISLTKLSSSV
jgi:hypothetical protein